MEHPKDEQFESQDELIQRLKSRIDDIDGINLFIDDTVSIHDRAGALKRTMRGVGGQIQFCNGETSMIHLEDMERFINDGLLFKMGIKVSLKTLKPRE